MKTIKPKQLSPHFKKASFKKAQAKKSAINKWLLIKNSRGFSLPGAIFIMVALAGIGVAMVTLNATTSSTSALNVQQSRAYYAALSGSEWAIATVAANDDNFAANNNSCIGVSGHSFVADRFTLSFSCSSTCSNAANCCQNVVDCQLSPRVSEITVTAISGSDTYQVKRIIQVTVSYDGS